MATAKKTDTPTDVFASSRLLNRVDGDRAFARQLLETGFEQLEEKMIDLKNAFDMRNLSAIAKTVHSIKGMAQCLSFNQIAHEAEEFEDSILEETPDSDASGKRGLLRPKDIDTDQLQSHHQQLKKAYQRLLRYKIRI